MIKWITICDQCGKELRDISENWTVVSLVPKNVLLIPHRRLGHFCCNDCEDKYIKRTKEIFDILPL